MNEADLFDIDPEGDLIERHCERCGHQLREIDLVENDAYACPDCAYAEFDRDSETPSIPERLIGTPMRALWPETRPVGVLCFALAVLIAWQVGFGGVGTLAIVGFVIAGAILVAADASRFCPDCGYESDGCDEGYCTNCGLYLDADDVEVDSRVDDPDAPDVITRGYERVNGWLPDGVEWSGPHLDVTTRRLAALDRLVVGPRRVWKAVLDVGILVAFVAQVAVLIGGPWLFWDIGSNWPVAEPEGGEAATLAMPELSAILIPVALIITVAWIHVAGHELSHALASRVLDVPVKEASVSLFFGVLPDSAYIWSDEDSDEYRSRMRIVSAGLLFNIATASIASGVYLALGYRHLDVGAVPLHIEFLVLFAAAGFMFAAINVVPIGGSDGHRLLRTAVRCASERFEGKGSAAETGLEEGSV